jgi:DNA polymerase-3 subunit gamma/tau
MEQTDLIPLNPTSLNLARKWRSSKFSEIVGQDLVVRILQNSLFKNQFFPVYLLSGQRGCGKTSTARVFAAAVNCFQLFAFQKDPKISVPCLMCESCMAMKKGQHPDFIEIDAASYTGVDNIRNIIDTSSFLPVLGHKKIYLIDEVHMLSKAAFNALLKILEEPSKSVLFILATTETQKIPDTVRSRCFQLLFSPVVDTQVVDHLEMICQRENIAYDQLGLQAIAHATHGSLRDAINLLEQARFAEASVSKASVTKVLGQIDDQTLYELLSAMMSGRVEQFFEIVKKFEGKTVSVDYVLKRILEIVYDFILLKYNAAPKYTTDIPDICKEQITHINLSKLLYWFEKLTELDPIITKTSKKQLLFESTLLRLMVNLEHVDHPEGDKKKNKLTDTDLNSDIQLFKQFVTMSAAHIDPVLASMLYATDLIKFDKARQTLEINTLKKFVLFQDLFLDQKNIYQKYLDQIFGYQTTLIVQFNKIEEMVIEKVQASQEAVPAVQNSAQQSVARPVLPQIKPKPVMQKAVMSGQFTTRRTERYQPSEQYSKNERTVDLTDTKKWKITHMLLEHFGGSVREIIKDTSDEFDA